MKVGARIGYARPWLQSVTGGDPTNALWRARGSVVEIEPDNRFAVVRWDDEDELSRVAVANIAELGSFKFAHADAKGWIGYGGLGEKPRSPWKGTL